MAVVKVMAVAVENGKKSVVENEEDVVTRRHSRCSPFSNAQRRAEPRPRNSLLRTRITCITVPRRACERSRLGLVKDRHGVLGLVPVMICTRVEGSARSMENRRKENRYRVVRVVAGHLNARKWAHRMRAA